MFKAKFLQPKSASFIPDPNWILREASMYQDQFEPGHPACTPAANLNWKPVEKFPLSRLAGFNQGEFDWADDVGGDEEYCSKMQEATSRGSIEPIIIAQGSDRKFYVWDGNHRVALAKELG